MPRVSTTVILIIFLLAPTMNAHAWSNGGYSADPTHPDYGTHDWIAEHALDWIPTSKKQYITDNLPAYIFGTELPDLPSTQGGIGDTTKHHVYYRSDGTLQDGAAATRAAEEYQAALSHLNAGNKAEAAKHAGAMAHYIADMAVFSHVMGAPTEWGTEIHHSDYENHATSITTTYSSTYIKPLAFDGALTTTSAGEAARRLALDTTLDAGGTYTARWMDEHYDWSNTAFTDRSWESVNLATNTIADALATLYDAYQPPKTPTAITCTPSKTSALDTEQITVSGTISADVSATVTIYRKAGEDWVAHATTTATHGVYSTQTSFTAGSYTIRASWEGDATHLAATSPETDITVQPRTGSVKVTVVDEKDAPLTETKISTTATPTGQTHLQTTTSTDGSATFSAIKPGAYTFSATKTGYKTNTGTCQVVEDQTVTVKITLTKENIGIPGYPIASVFAAMMVIMGYFIILRINRNKFNILKNI